MSRNIASRSIMFAFLLLLLGIVLLFAKKQLIAMTEKKIVCSMEEANHCAVNNDCVLVMFGCPFGCGAYIHKQEIDEIRKTVSFYFKLGPQQCRHSCAMPVTPVCQDGKCVPRSCELNKEYKTVFPDNCRCPPGSKAVVKSQKPGQGTFKCILEK